MNFFFHAAPIFRFAVGTIADLDLAANEFNQSIYGYLRDKYGTLGAANTIDTRGDALFGDKYKECSRSKIRRELEKLKRRGPVIQGPRLCDEILNFSRVLAIPDSLRSCLFQIPY